MPGSQVAAPAVYNLDQFVGQDMPGEDREAQPAPGNVVVSRRLAVEEKETAARPLALESLDEGAVVQGW